MYPSYSRPKFFVGDVLRYEVPTTANNTYYTFYMICEVRYKSGRRYRIRQVNPNGSWSSKWMTYADISNTYQKSNKLSRLIYG